jgi:cell division protease FtsH
LVNEAALLAARDNKKKISLCEFELAKDKVLMGAARRSMVISDFEKRNTAYHEAGHTIVGLSLPKTDPVHKVTIIPRGGALGITQTLPKEDILNLSMERAHNFIAFLMGGRCAEELIFNEKTNGASNDIERATDLARSMVCHWGMSSMGPINFGKHREHPFAGMGSSGEGRDFSDDTAKRIDAEVNKIVQDNYELAAKILADKKEILVRVAETLIIWETLNGDQIRKLMDGEDIGLPIITKKGGDVPPSASIKSSTREESNQPETPNITGAQGHGV